MGRVTKLTNKFIDYVLSFVCSKLALKTKRKIYIASLTGLLENSNYADDIIKLLNNKMKISKQVNELIIPLRLYKYFWSNALSTSYINIGSRTIRITDLLYVELNEQEVEEVVNSIYRLSYSCELFKDENRKESINIIKSVLTTLRNINDTNKHRYVNYV